jgi:glycosyltransferase involved in cell wall biosynthesis
MLPMSPSPRIRLLMTADAVGGVWSYAVDLVRGLAPHGVETTLAVLGPAPTANQRAAAAAVPGLRLLETALPLDWLADSRAEAVASGQALAALAKEVGADLVHLNTPAPAAGAAFSAPLVVACHSCVATWWDAVREGPLPDDFCWRAELTGQAYAEARLLIAPTAAFAAATARKYGLRQPPLVIHNGRRAMARPAAAQPAPADVAFTAGRLWDEGKDMATLDRAAAKLPIPVLAAGDTRGPNGAQVELKHLRLLGRLSDTALARVLDTRPIFVSPARYEPFGLAVLEAAQAGCALVLSDNLGFRELWDGVAEFVRPGDDAALAATVQLIATDRERRIALGVAARERAERFTVEIQAAAMLDAYRRILAGQGDWMQKDVAA